ncbi:hypothetical protein FNW52_02985 [Flavobacterium sp. ZT3R18]|uniref:hypothetical protein n=1 Tax=Flavobacterium sp. ZT3R18 TaxID=2594429 RepID=UPI00117B5153|nr:hypothetical protein [Flavobacterium sp. ZT3R18]TRX37880.1 hypothetical protein FNW52_02985 [Flavobacterium sp. ZT3R18]
MNIQEIKKQLPTGAIKEIANLSGVHYATVQGFFNGKQTKEDVRIIEVTAEYLENYKKKKSKATAKLQAVASA